MTHKELIKALKNRIKSISDKKVPVEITITHAHFNEALDKACERLKDTISYLNAHPNTTLLELNNVLKYNYPAIFEMSFETNCENKSLATLALENGNTISCIKSLKETEVWYYDNAIHNINVIKIK